MNAKKLVTCVRGELAIVEEHKIGEEDRVFFAHRDHVVSEPLTAGTGAGWYWQARGSSDCFGPFRTREMAVVDYESI